mmetsp:Transcript_15810/g.36679  ORF Transcript_15810/g.36679 Transcript_15810/m.36679 type:complete len:248 (+) Transcript_15810:2037-2780(+)
MAVFAQLLDPDLVEHRKKLVEAELVSWSHARVFEDLPRQVLYLVVLVVLEDELDGLGHLGELHAAGPFALACGLSNHLVEHGPEASHIFLGEALVRVDGETHIVVFGLNLFGLLGRVVRRRVPLGELLLLGQVLGVLTDHGEVESPKENREEDRPHALGSHLLDKVKIEAAREAKSRQKVEVENPQRGERVLDQGGEGDLEVESYVARNLPESGEHLELDLIILDELDESDPVARGHYGGFRHDEAL